MYKFYTHNLCRPPGCIKQLLLAMNPGLPRLNATIKRQIIMSINLTIVLLITAILHVSANTYAQKISLNESGASLEQVCKKIGDQSGYNFLYAKSTIQAAKPVNIVVNNASLTETLDKVFQNQPLQYVIKDNAVVIQKKDASVTPAPQPPGKADVTGHVADKQGVPLVNATVLIKRTKTGVLTDVNGNFVIRDVLPDDILVISYVGYKAASVTVGNQTVFNIVMEETTNELDKVVVQAYGTTSQRLATGDIGTVSAKEIEKQPVMNPIESLMGRVPGLVVTENNGYASAPVNVQIRGLANISGTPSDPLIIVDGVPMSLNGTGSGSGNGLVIPTSSGNAINGPAGGQSPLYSLNPTDIESISVLKDADATAIYGSRGGNGVILITTKKGKAGKTKFDVNMYQGINEVTNRYDLLNTQQYIEMRKEAFKNDGITPTSGNAYDILTWDTNRYTDYQKQFWGGLGKTLDLQTGLSGGNQQTTFRLSGNYHRQTSIFTYNGADQRSSIQFNITHKSLNQRLSISFTNFYSYSENDLVSLGGKVTIAPDSPPIFNSLGNLNYAGWAPVSNNFFFGNLLSPYNAKTTLLNSSLNLGYEIAKGLSVKAQGGYSANELQQVSTYPIIAQNPANNPTGTAQFGTTNQSNIIIEPQIEYNESFSLGKIDALIGGSFQSTSVNGTIVTGNGFVNDNLLYSIADAPVKSADNEYDQYRYEAFFGRLNYNYADEYILNLSARRDGSSRFGAGRQFGNFWAAGGAFIFTKENWFKENLRFLSFGKIRGSYGLTGTDQIGDYNYLTRWSGSTVISYQGMPAYVPTQHANPLLQWQTNRKLEIGTDLAFLNDRINIDLSWYRDRTGNQLVTSNLPGITGFDKVTENFPATVQNTGWEASLTAKLIDKKDISWSFRFNAGANQNKLISFPGLSQSPYASIYIVGQSLNTLYTVHSTGVDPLTGLYTFLDKNKDGIITNSYNNGVNDLVPVDLSIKLDGGFGSDFQYKNWQVSLFFNFRILKERSAIYNGIPGLVNANQSVEILNRWQNPGDLAEFAKYTTRNSVSYINYSQSDAIYSNASYIRLKNASISYQLSDKWLKSIGFQKCLVFARGQNLFLLTKYNGLDPDTPNLGSMPLSKTFVVGIQFLL